MNRFPPNRQIGYYNFFLPAGKSCWQFLCAAPCSESVPLRRRMGGDCTRAPKRRMPVRQPLNLHSGHSVSQISREDDLRFPLIAGKRRIHEGGFRFGRKQAYCRDDEQSCNHGESACINGRLQHGGEMAAEQHIADHKSCAKEEADPCGERRRFLPVKPVKEGGEESPCQRAPGYAHELCDKGDVALVLYNGNHRGNGDEYHD